MSYKLEIYGITDKGRMRDKNEDNFYYDQELGFMIIADGMGGHRKGELASEMAVKSVYEKYKEMVLNRIIPEINQSYLAETNMLIKAFDYANSLIWQYSCEHEEAKGMGTTLTAVVFHNENMFSVVHVGDSRAYLIRDKEIIQLTEDDSFVMEEYRKGRISLEDTRRFLYRNILTKAIGIKEQIDYFVYEQRLRDGDIVILATDGFTKAVEEKEVVEIINSNKFSFELCQKLVELANAKDGSDNITLVVARLI